MTLTELKKKIMYFSVIYYLFCAISATIDVLLVGHLRKLACCSLFLLLLLTSLSTLWVFKFWLAWVFAGLGGRWCQHVQLSHISCRRVRQLHVLTSSAAQTWKHSQKMTASSPQTKDICSENAVLAKTEVLGAELLPGRPAGWVLPLDCGLCSAVLYCTVLYCTILSTSCYNILYYIILPYAILCHTILYYTISCYAIPYYTILYCTTSRYAKLYHSILYFTILCHAML